MKNIDDILKNTRTDFNDVSQLFLLFSKDDYDVLELFIKTVKISNYYFDDAVKYFCKILQSNLLTIQDIRNIGEYNVYLFTLIRNENNIKSASDLINKIRENNDKIDNDFKKLPITAKEQTIKLSNSLLDLMIVMEKIGIDNIRVGSVNISPKG